LPVRHFWGSIINKKRVLIGLLVPFTLVILILLYLSLVYPFVTETFTLAPSETATRELSLRGSERAFIWVSTMPMGLSGRYAMDWVIKFHVYDPNNNQIINDPGIAGTGWLYPRSFVARESGTYTMYFENTVGGQFEKTISLCYKIAPSIFGIPIELMLLIIAVVLGLIVVALSTMLLIKTAKPQETTKSLQS
jgi:hypothetical protein